MPERPDRIDYIKDSVDNLHEKFDNMKKEYDSRLNDHDQKFATQKGILFAVSVAWGAVLAWVEGGRTH